MSAYTELIEFISNGEVVDSAITNRPTRQLDGNVRYLRDLLDAVIEGQTLIARSVTIKSDVKTGQPVFWNASTLQFEQGLATVDVDTATGLFATTASSQVRGIVLTKITATSADILLAGMAEVNLTEAVDGPIEAGLYYLSSSKRGLMTKTRPPIGIPVLNIDEVGTTAGKWVVYVNVQFTDFIEGHRHYKSALVVAPAGTTTPPTVGQRHTVTSADSSVEGWLPADDAVFAGKAPAGAAFGYNLSVGTLGTLWPPIPVDSAYLELDRGEDSLRMGMGVPLGQAGLALIDTNGIWWMSDCYGDVPWPTLLDTTIEESESVSVSVIECPRDLDMRLTLYFYKPVFTNENTAVLSLRGKPGSGLTFRCVGTDTEKQTGHLEADLDLDLAVASNTEPGHLVFKRLADNQFYRGPVISSITPGSSLVQITSTVAPGEAGEFYGPVTIDVNTDIDATEFPVNTVRLDGAEQEFYEDVLALGFSASRAAAFRGRIDVPSHVAIAAGTKMKLRFWTMGRAAGTLPAAVFTVSYRKLSQPGTVLTTKVALPTTDTALAMTTTATLDNPDEYVLMESDAFDISSGDSVLFSLSRSAPDGYSGELHILRQRGVLVAGGA